MAMFLFGEGDAHAAECTHIADGPGLRAAMLRERTGPVTNRLSGGTHRNVVMAGHIGRVVLSVRLGAPYAVIAFAVVLLVARPALPQPVGHTLGAARAGWLLIAATLAFETWVRVRRRILGRRRAAWLSEQSLRQAAEELAGKLSFVYGQDERWKQIRDPEPIEVAWRVPDWPSDLRLGSPSRYFVRATGQRLVVLGGAGAGKSVLALRLAHELLEDRARTGDGPVPILVPLASWDPRKGLFGWMAEQLADEHPGACTPVPGAPADEVAFTLLRTGRILPVLDGFDELPSGVRQTAMRELTQSLRGGHRFVLTSREPEFRAHVPDHGAFIRDEIVLCPLTIDAVAAFLNPGDRTGTQWSAVLDRLGDTDDRAPETVRLRRTLRVPLMVTLAKVAYGREGVDPTVLLERGRFSSRADIERHLYDAFLDAVYSRSHDDLTASGGWAPDQAREWAGFLAARMKAHRQQDLAWWHLDDEVPTWIRVCGIAPACALSVALVAWLGLGRSSLWWPEWDGVPVWGALAVLYGVAMLKAWLTARTDWHQAPSRLAVPTGPQVRGLWARRRYRIAALLVAAGGATGGVLGFARPYFAVVCGLLGAVAGRRTVRAVWPSADPSLARSPAGLLRSDRAAVLGLGWLTPIREISELIVPLAILWLPPVFLGGWSVSGGQDVVGIGTWAVTVAGTLTTWLLYAVAVSAWGRYSVARLYLAATGRLPLRLMAFLEDAHRRGVLRQSGGMYRFRHIELRDRLAQAAVYEAATVRQWPLRLRTGVGQLVGAAAAIGILAMLPAGLSARAATGPVRALPAACALLDGEDVDRLTVRAAKRASSRVPLLSAAGNPTRLPDQRGYCTVEEQSPFARSVRIEVRTTVYTAVSSLQAFDRRSGAEHARDELARRRRVLTALRSKEQSLEGLGDEARIVSGDPIPGVGNSEYEGGWDGVHPRKSATATASVRVGNAVIEVGYTEEFADRDRAIGVARILARRALQRAGFDDAVKSADTRTVADVPRDRVPAQGTRFNAYVDRPYRPLYGAVWRREDSAYIEEIPGHQLAFRIPRFMECGPAMGESTEGGREDQRICEGEKEFVRAGLVPDIRIDVWSHYCGAKDACDPKEMRTYADGFGERDRTVWKERLQGTVSYAVEHIDGKHRRYRMSLIRRWGFKAVSGKHHSFLLRARVEVPDGRPELAQKIVNDIFGQTCNFPSARPGCSA
ncbi:NACHT domain-containing protein [Streptomyces sp. NPDC015032]|uniref:NACHT domain-containing protein n=1 Tax=Streptomyces sp. NPDC015032 TaxID=3364937 RepID=UPI0036F8F057